jgi:hypothetical protein
VLTVGTVRVAVGRAARFVTVPIPRGSASVTLTLRLANGRLVTAVRRTVTRP